MPEKEIEYALEAFKLFSTRANQRRPQNGVKWKFVIAGALSKRPEHQAYYKKLHSICTEDVRIEPDISEERLLELYSRCYATFSRR